MWENEDNLFDLPFTNEKDLGIIFENNLKFNLHILNTVNKTNKLIGMIKRAFLSMNKTLFPTTLWFLKNWIPGRNPI